MACGAASLHDSGRVRGAATSCSHDLDWGELGIQSIRHGGGLRALFPEHQASHAPVPVDAQVVAHFHLFRGQEVGQREDHMPLDGPLQVPCAIALIRPFVQEKLAARSGHVEQELPLLGFQSAVAHASARSAARQEPANLNVSQDGAGCRGLRQTPKAATVEAK